MNRRNFQWRTQFVVVLLSALTAKLYYSTATVNELRWILAPTTALVERVTNTSFEFESYTGYMSGDHTFLIAASCAGVNFLITAFLMLSLRRWWRGGPQDTGWSFLPAAAVIAYLVTLIANTTRISIALWLHSAHVQFSWLSANQLHRLEGIVVYFGCLLLLFLVIEKISANEIIPNFNERRDLLTLIRRASLPLVVYYVMTLAIPLAHGAYRQTDFWEHSLFVLLGPLALMCPVAAFWFYKNRPRTFS